jgi:hypothetical protein
LKKLILFSVLALGFAAHADYTPFTPNAGVTTGLGDDSCVAYDGDQFLKNPEIDFFSAECLGLGGWRVISHGGDARSYVKFINGKYGFDLQGRIDTVGQFPNIESGIEWRVQRVQGKSVTPIAALVAVSGQDPEDINKANGQYLIIKLGAKACIIDKIAFDAKDGNAEKAALVKARTEADAKAAAYKCK